MWVCCLLAGGREKKQGNGVGQQSIFSTSVCSKTPSTFENQQGFISNLSAKKCIYLLVRDMFSVSFFPFFLPELAGAPTGMAILLQSHLSLVREEKTEGEKNKRRGQATSVHTIAKVAF